MIFVTGATGRVGKPLVESLLAAGQPVKVLVRTPQQAANFSRLGCAVVIGDLNQLDVWEGALQGCDRLMSIPPNTWHQATQEIALFQAAKRANVRHIVKLSSVKANLKSACHFFRQHAIAEQFLKSLGVPFTILQSNSFMQNFFWFRHEMKAQATLSLPLQEAQIAPIDIGDVVNVAHAVLAEREPESAVYNITGIEKLSLKAVAKIFAKTMGKSITDVNISAHDFKQMLLQARVEEWYAEAVAMAWQIASVEDPNVTDDVARITGKSPTTFEQFTIEHTSIFL